MAYTALDRVYSIFIDVMTGVSSGSGSATFYNTDNHTSYIELTVTNGNQLFDMTEYSYVLVVSKPNKQTYRNEYTTTDSTKLVIEMDSQMLAGSGNNKGQLYIMKNVNSVAKVLTMVEFNYIVKEGNYKELAPESTNHDALYIKLRNDVDNILQMIENGELGSGSGSGGTGMTPTQRQQLTTAYNHAMSDAVTTTDVVNSAVATYVEANKAALKGDTGAKGDKGEKGDTGAKGQDGAKGADGATPTLKVGTVTTLAAGSNATVNMTGSNNVYTIDFGIPKGAKGDTGSSGGGEGTTVVNPTLNIGTVTGGTIADASITGDSPNYTLNLVLPKGEKGDTGAKGDKGEKGDTGADGVAGAKGDKGDRGEKGADGVTPTLSIGTVTTGAAGSSASVTVGGTAPSYVLNFTIPKGDKGDKGDTGASGSGSGGSGLSTKVLSLSEITEILKGIVVEIPVESITVSTNYLAINVGETRQITYNILPANATDKTVTYSSSDNSKVSVDQLGNIKALAEGDVLITVTCSNGVSTDCQVVVSAVSEVVAVTGISLNKNSVSMHTGDTLTLKATISPNNATNKSVKWESSAPTVASIDNNGLVTALSDGSATITCTSLSNTSVSANCTIGITTTKVLTSVTNGLVHSYDLTALNGSSATIEDLTGNVVLTMDGFSDVASAKTADGIVTEANSRLKQEAVSPTVTNEYSIVFTAKGERIKSQGLLKCNSDGNNKGFAVSYNNSNIVGNMLPLCMTHSAFLINGVYSTRDAFNYETITVTADYNTKEIKLYSGSYLLGTASFDGFEWSNKAWFNDGYWGTKAGLCYRNILMYNRILSGEEVATIASEVCPSRTNTANSPMVTANNRILSHISCNSTLTEGVLPNLVAEHYPLNSVASTTSEGFLVSANGTSYIKSYFSPKVTYVVKLGTIPNSSNEKRIINGLTNIEAGNFSMYSYIKDSRFAVRDASRWLIHEQTVTINDINVIMVEVDALNKTTTVYFNNKQVGSLNNYSAIFSGLENTEIPIKDFIIYDGIFDEGTRTAIYNELIGGGN